MTEGRLPTRFWVQALVRRCSLDGIGAVIARKGDDDRGAVLVKVNRFAAGCVVWTQTWAVDGAAAWMRGTGAAQVDEPAADAYVTRQVTRDPDLWVIEIDDAKSAWQPDGKIL